MTPIVRWTGVVVSVFLVVELIGRYFGLCDYPLYMSNPHYEYIHAPNQQRYIYRNLFLTNAWSMRSTSFDAERDTTVVLLVGDSAINGGNLTHHDSLASTLLEKWLSHELGENIRVLNISAGSWGPDNVAAYLLEHGTFNADAIVLVCNSNDAIDQMDFVKKVGVHPQYPDQQKRFAWSKLWERGLPFLGSVVRNKNQSTGDKSANDPFNPGFERLKTIAESHNIPFIVYLHANRFEMERGEFSDGGKRILHFCDKSMTPCYPELDGSIKTEHFVDHVHYSESGQRFLALQLLPIIIGFLNKN